MQRQEPQDAVNRYRGSTREQGPDIAPMSPVLQILGFGMLIALLLLS